MANICGNYLLLLVTKDTLQKQVGLGICMARFASHCGIIGAHPKQSRFQIPLQLGAKCLVISQLTMGILGILRRHCIPLATDPHALAFAMAPLHSTFIQQLDGVSCHPACLLTLHCALSRRVVKGILQVPQDRFWLLREMAKATLYFSRSKLASTPRTPAVHWEVARMYPEPKSVDFVDTCFSCDGTPHMACHECKVLHCALHASILCQSEICVGLCQF